MALHSLLKPDWHLDRHGPLHTRSAVENLTPLRLEKPQASRARRAGRRALVTMAAIGTALPVGMVTGVAAAATPTAPPPVTFLSPNGPVGHGDIFITPTGGTATYANGPELLGPDGNIIWFHAVPEGETAADFRAQEYYGQ